MNHGIGVTVGRKIGPILFENEKELAAFRVGAGPNAKQILWRKICRRNGCGGYLNECGGIVEVLAGVSTAGVLIDSGWQADRQTNIAINSVRRIPLNIAPPIKI